MKLREFDRSYRLSLGNGISLDVLKRGRAFGGIGQVRMKRRKLRSVELPIMPLVRTPDGYEAAELQVGDVARDGDVVTFSLIPFMVRTGRMEWVCGDGQDRWNVGPWEQEPVRDRGGSLEVTIRPVVRTLGGVEFVGFSYAYRYRSRKYRIYRIHDRATWELGGYATGNTVWMSGPFNEPHKTFRNKRDAFTTSWCARSSADVQIQQFLPFFTVLQGFTFQHDAQSALVTTFEAPFHCRSLLQKNCGENCLVHWHQLCGDLGGCLDFPALQVLWAPCDDDAAALANLYCRVRDAVHRGHTEQAGIVREAEGGGCGLITGGVQAPEAVQRGLDELAHAGCVRVYARDLCRGLGPSGGEDADGARRSPEQARRDIRAVAEHAHQRGMEIAVPLADCCTAWLTDGALGPGATRDPATLVDRSTRRAFIAHLRSVRSKLAIDGVFRDGEATGLDGQFAWRTASSRGRRRSRGRTRQGYAPDFDAPVGEILSLAGPRGALVRDLQRLGYSCLLAGPSDLGGVCEQRDLSALRGREFMFRGRVVAFPAEDVSSGREDAAEVYFRGCAHRLSYALPYDVSEGAGGSLAAWWTSDMAAVNNAYHAVAEHMEESQILPGERGVLWTGVDPDVQVLWCFRKFRWQVGDEADVFEVVASRRVEPHGGSFAAEPLCVYLVQGAAPP